MKKRILLIDESLTVQKVVALTLDKNRYALYYAKSRNEALKQWSENPPELILVGDQVPDINVSSFPKEMEVWVGKGVTVPPMILITSHETREQKNYAGVLKKPFAPSALQAMVSDILATRGGVPDSEGSPDEFEDQRLQKIFNDTFADESTLVRETFRAEAESAEAAMTSNDEGHSSPWGDTTQKLWADNTPPAPPKKTVEDLWSPPPAKPAPEPREKVMEFNAPATSHISQSQIPHIEQELSDKLGLQELNDIVDRLLAKIVPPIVERLVQERLDQLLKAQDDFVELKP